MAVFVSIFMAIQLYIAQKRMCNSLIFVGHKGRFIHGAAEMAVT